MEESTYDSLIGLLLMIPLIFSLGFLTVYIPILLGDGYYDYMEIFQLIAIACLALSLLLIWNRQKPAQP